jgi:hypothetical protein
MEHNAMKFSRIIVIDDQSKGNNIPFNGNSCYCGPVDIQTAEEYEFNLNRMKIPYILAQAETVIQTEILDEVEPRYARGYFIFICNNDIKNMAGLYDA